LNGVQEIRRAAERGYADHGWLKSFHSFSFADYFDPEHVEFGVLRVINEDRVAAGQGFGTHSHRDMEIISYVLAGELAHKDSTGTSSTIRPGDVQRMSAGRGVQHSEFNPSVSEGVHFLQIWIEPNTTNGDPGYEEKHFDTASKTGKLRLIASNDGRDGSVSMRQDAEIYATIINGEDALRHPLRAGRQAYVHVIRGRVTVNGIALGGGDALKVTDEADLTLGQAEAAEVLVFDLPK
jgi:redox-sensitive bicupin YhaK (pirin superfamily)